MNKYKQEKKGRKPGTNKYDKEARDLKRDSICAILVLLVLVLAPIGITFAQNRRAAAEAQANEEYLKALQEALASASQASASEASSAADGDTANDDTTDAEAENASAVSGSNTGESLGVVSTTE